jgi:4-hydroxymandelate oxidase
VTSIARGFSSYIFGSASPTAYACQVRSGWNNARRLVAARLCRCLFADVRAQSFQMPIVAKGVLNPDDAEIGIKSGISAVIVSNHGGRNLDTVPASIDALPLVAEKVAGRIPVLVDGGIRRGTDVLKAIALGANAVLIGRPYIWGLGAEGAAGVAKVVNILRREFAMAMALTGRTTIASTDRSVIWS